MADRNTNEDLVVHMMNFSEVGALGQGLIIEAITRYAKTCSDITDEDIAENQNSLVSFETLKKWGIETTERMNEFYKSNKLT